MIDISQLIQDVEDGNESPLKALATLRMLAKDVKGAIDHIEGYAIEEAKNYSEKTFKDFGFQFERKEGSKRYDFSKIDEWSALTKAVKDKEAVYKLAASAYEKGNQMFDDETGEQIPIPLVKYSKASLTIKQIKE